MREATGGRAARAPLPAHRRRASSPSSRSGSTRLEPRRRPRAGERDRGAASGSRRPRSPTSSSTRSRELPKGTVRLCMFTPRGARARARLARAGRRRPGSSSSPRRRSRRSSPAAAGAREHAELPARRLRPARAGALPADRARLRAVRAQRDAVLLLPEHRSRCSGPTPSCPTREGDERARLRARRSPPMIGAERRDRRVHRRERLERRATSPAPSAPPGFGPSKSSDFALSLGPVLVTPDEFAGTRLVARVNGEERCGADTAGARPPLAGARRRMRRATRLSGPATCSSRASGRRRGPGASAGRRRRARGRGDRRAREPRRVS